MVAFGTGKNSPASGEAQLQNRLFHFPQKHPQDTFAWRELIVQLAQGTSWWDNFVEIVDGRSI
jgi:hypothetical protein